MEFKLIIKHLKIYLEAESVDDSSQISISKHDKKEDCFYIDSIEYSIRNRAVYIKKVDQNLCISTSGRLTIYNNSGQDVDVNIENQHQLLKKEEDLYVNLSPQSELLN